MATTRSMKVYLSFTGEYENWGPVAAFTSRELAEEHCRSMDEEVDVHEFEVWDHVPGLSVLYRARALTSDGNFIRISGDVERRDGYTVEFSNYPCDEYHAERFTNTRLYWWTPTRVPDSAIGIEIVGPDEQRVRDDVERMMASVLAGELRPVVESAANT